MIFSVSVSRWLCPFLASMTLNCLVALVHADERPLPDLPPQARLVLSEDWNTGAIDSEQWYLLRKQWGNGNHGVVPENIYIDQDIVFGQKQNVVICRAHGDLYDGEIVGYGGAKTRVGGVFVSKEFFASGRYEVVMKIGNRTPHVGGPVNPIAPSGAIPAVWTYGYRWVQAPEEIRGRFSRELPLYNPHMGVYGGVANEYWSEIDFPEFGKAGQFKTGLYNTFLQNQHESRTFNVQSAVDGEYHRLTTEWRTHLVPLPEIGDDQVVEAEGVWWIQDKAVPFSKHFGNPLKKLGKNQYAVYAGRVATHWIDGKFVGENTRFVPSMSAQLNLGIWLPDWAGPAEWKTAEVRFANIQVWQYGDEGDLFGILTEDLLDNFDTLGKPLK
ncbi:MAG TPA: hypothetical protein VNQ76_04805 [Planctomicrobium sp.]|nr:hypothetical protein [Planctomicrobium sp.]